MNFYKISGQLTSFVVSWVAKNIEFKNILSFKSEKDVFTIKTKKDEEYELKFNKKNWKTIEK